MATVQSADTNSTTQTTAPAPVLPFVDPTAGADFGSAIAAGFVGSLAAPLAPVKDKIVKLDFGGIGIYVIGGVLVLIAIIAYAISAGETVAGSETVQKGTRAAGFGARVLGSFA